ncbi:hypothetical protein FHW79_000150 [Azospirillum sp. OGB3]|uniref:hypothetical protein n=1 Tax=Azospirillum sp. OGB3 TaxID=2587012 RepID=UPI001605D951|nr:hypothetical protein [Azospirillum sp. OGB3]MBB3262563.1 hypothetical protein [Azospirillum sp. OGB3]
MPHLRARPVRLTAYDSTADGLWRHQQPAVVRRASARDRPAQNHADATNSINA